HRQLLLERADHDLKDALDVLTLADRSGDLLQQAETRQLGLYLGVRELAVGDVPGNLGCADDAALTVAEGRDGDGYINFPSVLANAYRFEMIGGFTARNSRQDSGLLARALRRDEHRHRFANRLLRGIAE